VFTIGWRRSGDAHQLLVHARLGRNHVISYRDNTNFKKKEKAKYLQLLIAKMIDFR